jgi:hypothetical protein
VSVVLDAACEAGTYGSTPVVSGQVVGPSDPGGRRRS